MAFFGNWFDNLLNSWWGGREEEEQNRPGSKNIPAYGALRWMRRMRAEDIIDQDARRAESMRRMLEIVRKSRARPGLPKELEEQLESEEVKSLPVIQVKPVSDLFLIPVPSAAPNPAKVTKSRRQRSKAETADPYELMEMEAALLLLCG